MHFIPGNSRLFVAAATCLLVVCRPAFGESTNQDSAAQASYIALPLSDSGEATSQKITDPRFDTYIVPEGVEMDPSARFWYRIGDLGNGVQEGEIVKTLRLVIGVDDTQPDRLQFFPRRPFDWTEMAVEKYPVVFARAGKMETTQLHYKLERTGKGLKLQMGSAKELGIVTTRLGPFEQQPDASDIQVNGKVPDGTAIEHSGDSWWVRFKLSVGPDDATKR